MTHFMYSTGSIENEDTHKRVISGLPVDTMDDTIYDLRLVRSIKRVVNRRKLEKTTCLFFGHLKCSCSCSFNFDRNSFENNRLVRSRIQCCTIAGLEIALAEISLKP